MIEERATPGDLGGSAPSVCRHNDRQCARPLRVAATEEAWRRLPICAGGAWWGVAYAWQQYHSAWQAAPRYPLIAPAGW